MYLEGLGFHAIACLLGVSHVSIINWIHKYAKELEAIRNPRAYKLMELDEMHSYIGNKNYQWIWIGVDRDSREYIDLVVGSRGTKMRKKLWDKVKDQAVGLVATDHWRVYNEIIPIEKLMQTKAETDTVKSYNAQIRHFLARFGRRSNAIQRA